MTDEFPCSVFDLQLAREIVMAISVTKYAKNREHCTKTAQFIQDLIKQKLG